MWCFSQYPAIPQYSETVRVTDIWCQHFIPSVSNSDYIFRYCDTPSTERLRPLLRINPSVVSMMCGTEQLGTPRVQQPTAVVMQRDQHKDKPHLSRNHPMMCTFGVNDCRRLWLCSTTTTRVDNHANFMSQAGNLTHSTILTHLRRGGWRQGGAEIANVNNMATIDKFHKEEDKAKHCETRGVGRQKELGHFNKRCDS